MASPDAHARVTGSCGDTMEMFLKIEKGRVEKATFQTDGCAASTVWGAFAAEMAISNTLDELAGLIGQAVLKRIGRFPEKDERCAFLAAKTLQKARGDFAANRHSDTGV